MRRAIQRASITSQGLWPVVVPFPTRASTRLWASSTPAFAEDEQQSPQAGPSRHGTSFVEPQSSRAHLVCEGHQVPGRRGKRPEVEASQVSDSPSFRPDDYGEQLEPPRYFSFDSKTSRAHYYSPDSAYGAIVRLPATTRADVALDMLPQGPVPPYVLAVIMRMRKSTLTLSRLLPFLTDPSIGNRRSLTYHRARLDALAAFLAACTRLKGFIFLPPAIDAVFESMDALTAHDRMTAKKEGAAASRLLARYQRLLSVMVGPEARRPAPAPGSELRGPGLELPQPLRYEMDRIVRHVLTALDGMGSSLAARPSALMAFFGPFLTSDTVDRLVQHTRDHGISLLEWHWRNAANVAFAAGRKGQGIQYLAYASQAYENQRVHEYPTSELAVHPVHRLMAAGQARTLQDAVKALRPLLDEGLEESPSQTQSRLQWASDLEASGEALESSAPEDTGKTLGSSEPAIEPLDPPSATPSYISSPSALSPSAALPSASSSSSASASSRPLSRQAADSLHADMARGKKIPNPDRNLSSAWSVLLTRAGADPKVSNDAFVAIAARMPELAVCAATVTPVMHALGQRGLHVRALQVWRGVQHRYAAATRAVRRVLIDAPLITVAVEARSRVPQTDRDPVALAIRTMDYYAARPADNASQHETDTDDETGGAWGRMEGYRKIQHSVPLDTKAFNALLRICLREGRPSVAFRLWSVAEERWGIVPDDASLATLLETARYAGLQKEDTLEERVQMMKDTFSFRSLARLVAGGTPDVRPSRGLLQNAMPHETRALLDPPGYTWRKEYGAASPADIARGLFEEVIFSNWPALAEIPSPLSRGHGRAMHDLASLIRPLALERAPHSPPPAGTRFAHLVPCHLAWEAYIKLLANYFPSEDIALPLAYMRALGVVPRPEAMLAALNAVGEAEGPRTRVATPDGPQLMRDEQIVRAYLEDWLSGPATAADKSAAVPSEEEVAHYRRHKYMAYRQRRQERQPQQ